MYILQKEQWQRGRQDVDASMSCKERVTVRCVPGKGNILALDKGLLGGPGFRRSCSIRVRFVET